MRHPGADERGAVLLIVAFCMTLLLGFAAIAIDIGYARQLKAQAQNSADFAALAGAGELVSGTIADAKAVAHDYASKNGFAVADVNVPPTSGTKVNQTGCVQVKPSESFPTIFGRIFNVGTLSVGAQATACASPPLGGPYAVFAGSTTCPDAISFSGANRTINGGVHSNNDVKITSSGTVINGTTTYLNGSAPAGSITFNPSTDNPTQLTGPLPYPDDFSLADYQPGGAKAVLAGTKYHNAGSADIDEAWLTSNLLYSSSTISPGLYYTSGNINLSGPGHTALGATFVTSNGDVHFNGNNFTFTPWDPDGLLIASFKNPNSCSSGQAVIKLNGNNHTWTGIMFAPNGPLDFSGTNVDTSLNGRLVANSIKLSGSNQTLTRNDSYPGRAGGFELVE